MEVSEPSEGYPLLKRSSREYIGDEPPRSRSTASLSSLVDTPVDKLANIPEVMMNTFKSFVGSGILGMKASVFVQLLFLSIFFITKNYL